MYRKLFGSVLLLIPVVLAWLPSDFFDHGESICLSKALLNVSCYACGMTRAVMHLIHLDFQIAWEYNALCYLVLPLVGLLWLQFTCKQFGIHILRWA
jgi:hypothetical protein